MKYALFEFAPIEGSGSTLLAVGESCWIIDVEDGMLNNDDFDLAEEVEVTWNDGKTYWAKVHRFSVFPTLVEKLTNQVESRCTSAVSSPCSTSTGIPSTIPSTPEPVAIPINVIDKEQMAKTEESIPHDVVAMCQSTDPRKMTNKLLKTVFGTEHLGTHSLTGNAGSKTTPAKPALDSKKVMAIINLVVKTFSNESERTVRHYITDYLNNSAKSLRATISLSQSSV